MTERMTPYIKSLPVMRDEDVKLSYLEAIGKFNDDERLRGFICRYELGTGYRLIQHEFIRVVENYLRWEGTMDAVQFCEMVKKCTQ